MARKSALIVDDSRTARRFLSRVLEQHQMDVQTAESAETALEILSSARPDVIFMDHMMPGMDGFQALRAIKNNPATATIPIMMYTSQSGELYVGQARALGAVGVLPKQIKPVEVSELLESLHLVPDLASVAADEIPTESAAASDGADEIEGAIRPGDWDELHRWLEEMLRHHGDNLRSDIETSMARLLSERFPEESPPEEPAPEPELPPPADESRRTLLTSVLVFSLAAIAAVFLWLHLDTQKKWQQVALQNTALLSAMDQQRLAEAEEYSRSAGFSGCGAGESGAPVSGISGSPGMEC